MYAGICGVTTLEKATANKNLIEEERKQIIEIYSEIILLSTVNILCSPGQFLN